jgi:hypothetical protein
MAYEVTSTTNSTQVAEREYASGVEVLMFTGFDSCIGVVTRTGNSLTGIHLALMDANCELFNATAAVKVLQLLSKTQYDEASIIGSIGDWQQCESAEVRAGFEKLESGLKQLGKFETHNFNPGTYGAKVKDEKIVFTRSF